MKKPVRTRRLIQLFFLSVSAVIFAMLISGVWETAHAFCPYSPVCFGCLNLGQQLQAHFFPAAAIFGILLIISTIFTGRLFCGYVCPFGTLGELIYSLNPRRKKARKKNLIPRRIHLVFSKLKYLILVVTAVLAALGLNYIYMQFCPVLSIAHIQVIRIAGIASLVVIVGLGFFIERFWCNYLCPMAALFNLAQYAGRLLHLPRRKIYWCKSDCIDCDLCDNLCPMQICVKKSDNVEDPECIYCGRCQQCCPVLKKRNKNDKK